MNEQHTFRTNVFDGQEPTALRRVALRSRLATSESDCTETERKPSNERGSSSFTYDGEYDLTVTFW